MITDEKMIELVQRTQVVVMRGLARNVQLPEHVAVDSPLVAAVFTALLEEERAELRTYDRVAEL